MDWTVSFTELDGAALVRTSGVFTAPEHLRMVEDIVGRQEWRPGHPILFDHRNLSFDDVRYEDMVSARDNHFAHESDIGNARSAMLMKSAADYGVGRQFQMLVEDQAAVVLQVFTDESVAREWLFQNQEVRAQTQS
jgi:hypothetical protein